MPLQREAVVDAVASPESAIGWCVGVYGAADEPRCANPVIAAQRVRRHRRQENLLASIRTAVHQHDRLAPGDVSFGGDSGPNADFRILTAEAGCHLFLPGIFQHHGAPGHPRQKCRDRLYGRIEFQAESATDRWYGDPHTPGRKLHDPSGDVAHCPRHLCRGLDVSTAVLPGANGNTRLEGHMALPADGETAFDNAYIGTGEGSVDVAATGFCLPCWRRRSRSGRAGKGATA